jgi:hypothetical protein
MIVRRVGPLSVAKVAGALYAIMGLIFGGILTVFSLAGAVASAGEDNPFVGVLFGIGAIVLLPIFYGVLGFVVTALMAALYNVVADAIGGVEVELEGTPGPTSGG